MTYPGNETISPEIRQRILETFRQTIELASRGNAKEADLGCDFILRLDPLFEPARELQKQLSEGARIDPQALPESWTALLADDDARRAASESQDDSQRGDLGDQLEGAEDELDEALDALEAGAPEEASAEASQPVPQPVPTPEEMGDQPAVALDSESERRIQELLQEGQEAFERLEYQAAIDAWSRIFLIDIEHPEAGRRIEVARKLKAEVERSAEESLHEGIAQVERGDLEGAKASFHKVLEVRPGHTTAQEYLEKLEARELPEPPAEPAAAPETGAEAEAEVLVPPSPAQPPAPELQMPDLEPALGSAAPAARASRTMAAGAPERRKRPLLILGAAVLGLVVVGGWILYRNWDRTFPNASETQVEAPARIDPLARARALHEEGKTSIAVAQLRRIAPDDPLYAEAQALLARWETPAPAETAEELTESEVASRQRLVEASRQAAAASDFVESEELLLQAAELAPLEGEEEALRDELAQRLGPYREQIEVVRQGEWEIALRNLWRIRDTDPDNPILQRLMVDCYYNLGVRDLQRGDAESAAEQFREALALAPRDAELTRLASFAGIYRERPQDLLYRIFVKYLPFR